MLQMFSFAFSHIELFIKDSDITDINHVTFWPRDLWDNFNMKVYVARILDEKKGF